MPTRLTRRGPALALTGLLAALALGLAAAPRAAAQPRRVEPAPAQPPQIPAGGTDLFRALLDRAGIEPVRENDRWRFQGADLIVIVVGDPSFEAAQWGQGELAEVRAAVQRGGAALVASDGRFNVFDAFNPPERAPPVGWFRGVTVRTDWTKPGDAYRGMTDCPFAVPVSPDELLRPREQPGRTWAVFRGLSKVATNQPTYLQVPNFRNEYQYPLARFPEDASAEGVGRLDRPDLRTAVLAVGGDGPAHNPYSFLAVADSSIFINQMLLAPGTDNLKLALNVIEYLQGPNKERKRCLFYENGRVVDRFDGLKSALAPPRPPVPPDAMPGFGDLLRNQGKLIELADGLLDEAQKRDLPHRLAVGEPGSERERRSAAGWAEVAAVLLAVAACRLLFAWFFRVRVPGNVPPVPNSGAGAASTGPPGVFDRRQKELVRRNSLFDPVRTAVREFFASTGVPPDPGPRMPDVEVSGTVPKPEALRHVLFDLWRLAYGDPVNLSAARWFELEPYFDRLKQAHADGQWRFLL